MWAAWFLHRGRPALGGPVIPRNLAQKRTPITDPNNEATRRSIPTRATGRRPKESASGPENKMETAQAAKVAVISWPASATETSKPVAIPPGAPEPSGQRSGRQRRTARLRSKTRPCLSVSPVLVSLAWPFNPSLFRKGCPVSERLQQAIHRNSGLSRCPRATAWRTPLPEWRWQW